MDSPTTSTRLGSDDLQDKSLGDLVSAATRDLSLLVRKEVELAKIEVKQEVKTAGKGAGLFGGAGVAGLFALIFLSISAAYGISAIGVPLGCAFFLVGAVYLIAAAVLALSGKKQISELNPPEKTLETLKDDLEWAKHPTRA